MTLLVSATGMTTAVGHDAATSCAAIRAGISRAAPIPHAAALDPDAQALVPVIGHSVWGLTEGASAVARWQAMAANAFRDMCESANLPVSDDGAYWSRVGLMLITPELEGVRFLFCDPCQSDAVRSSYVDPLVAKLQVPLNRDNVFLLSAGRVGAIRAIENAKQLFARRTIDRLVVLAADSNLDAFSLLWLGESERLKAPDKPSGLMPGEAAVAIMLDDPSQVTVAPVAQKAWIKAAIADREPEAFGERRHGAAMARALTHVLHFARLGQPFVGDLITDLNGEEWRAYEFGAAISRVDRSLLQDYQAVLPAFSTGDVGAASALLGTALAVRAFERRYASGSTALISCMSLSGWVGTLVLESA